MRVTPLTPCWPPLVITSISCFGGSSVCCLCSWQLKRQRLRFNWSEIKKFTTDNLAYSNTERRGALPRNAARVAGRRPRIVSRQKNNRHSQARQCPAADRTGTSHPSSEVYK